MTQHPAQIFSTKKKRSHSHTLDPNFHVPYATFDERIFHGLSFQNLTAFSSLFALFAVFLKVLFNFRNKTRHALKDIWYSFETLDVSYIRLILK